MRKVAEEWGLRGLLTKGGVEDGKKTWQSKKKTKEDEEEEKKYKPHPKDMYLFGVGRRIKLVVDSQITAQFFNKHASLKGDLFQPLRRRCLNVQYRLVKPDWKPFS